MTRRSTTSAATLDDAVAERPLAEWELEILRRPMWSEGACLYLLCGQSDIGASRSDHADWNEFRKRIREAVFAKELTVADMSLGRLSRVIDALEQNGTPDAANLAKELREDRKWAGFYVSMSTQWYVMPEAFIAWATAPPGRFPKFPFTLADRARARGAPVEPDAALPTRPALVWRIVRDGEASGEGQKALCDAVVQALGCPKRTAESYVALFRSDQAIAQDARASRHRTPITSADK